MSEKQPEALMLADDCEGIGETDGWPQLIEAAAELRRLHQENEKLREAGVGYSQQTMDAVVRERENLRSLNAELLEALSLISELALNGLDHAHPRIVQEMMDEVIEKAEGRS
jgi:F420-dependent methylenetetrahydromethanopterin dehydrogenase